jgi:hypothetical protein
MFAKHKSASGRPSVDDIIAQNTSPLAMPGRRGGWSNFFWAILVLALAGSLIKLYVSYQDLKTAKDNMEKNNEISKVDPATLSDEELFMFLSGRAELPSGTSTIATVKDVESLRTKDPFFAKAANGDKVIQFDREALLYRPGTDKIVRLGPSNDSSVASSTTGTADSSTTATTGKITVEVRNGTATAGLAGTWKGKINANSLYSVDKVGNASKDTYTQAYVVNLKGKDVSALEKDLGVTAVTTLPEGETASNQDVLIIVTQ